MQRMPGRPREKSSSQSSPEEEKRGKRFKSPTVMAAATSGDPLQKVLEHLEKQSAELKAMEERMKNEIKENCSAVLSQVAAKMDRLAMEWKQETAVIVAKQKELENRLDRIERKEKKNNVIVTGMPATKDTKGAINELFSKQLKKAIQVQDAFAVVLKSGSTKTIVKMENWEQKMEVLRSRADLPKDIFVSEDLIPKDQFIQFKAREFARQERGRGKEAKVGQGKVFVNGAQFTWEESTQTFCNKKN